MPNNQTPPSDAPERNLEARGLRTKVPKPNILRIEVLDGKARERYLGSLQKFADREIKQTLYDNFVPATETVFYGFIKNQGNQGVSVTTRWGGEGGTGGLLGDIRASIDKAASGGSFLGNVAGVASNAINAGENIENAVKAVTGLDANLTGSASLKRVSGVEVGSFEVSCGWYLPEQLNLAIASLRILTRMAYPRQIADQAIEKFIGDAARATVNKAEQEIDKFFTGANNVPPSQTDATQENLEATEGGIAGVVGGLAEAGVGAYNAFNSIVGRNLTLDPLPVRVSIGQYIDIEPMVITDIKIEFSKEQWVAPNKRHLPIFCEVSISVSSWLNPAPELEFMQLLGTEMFGLDAHQKAIINQLNADDKVRRDAEQQRLQEEANRRVQATSDSTRLNPSSPNYSSAATYEAGRPI